MDIREVLIETSDIAKQREFYCSQLSLPASEASSNSLELQIGASRLTFVQAPRGARRNYHFAFNIPPQQFSEAKSWIARHVPLLTGHSGANEFYFEAWNAHAVYFYDPAGNIVELIARHTVVAQRTEPFTGRNLLNVSEIGLVTNNVPDIVNMLCSQIGASIYQQTAGRGFAAVGNEDGLLILVERGRIWSPDTGKPANSAPVCVTVVENGKRATVTGPPYRIGIS